MWDALLDRTAEHLKGFAEYASQNPETTYLYSVFDERIPSEEMEKTLKQLKKMLADWTKTEGEGDE